MLGDVHIAEPNALICFAGPRVIEQTIREKLPEGFQRAEYLLEHGMLDRVTQRSDLREELITITRMLMGMKAAVKGDLPAPGQPDRLSALPAPDSAQQAPRADMAETDEPSAPEPEKDGRVPMGRVPGTS